MVLKVHDGIVELPNGNIFFQQWTPDEVASNPIILLHDSLGSVGLWRDFPAALAEVTQRVVIAYDRLGFGQSSLRAEPIEPSFIHDEAQVYLPAIIETLGINQYVLFGHSVGGSMALVAASIHADNCVAVISESAQSIIEEQTLAGIRAAKQDFLDEEQFAKLTKWHGERAGWVLNAWTGMWLSAEFRSWTLDAYLSKISCPLLAIHGDADEFGSCESPRRIVRLAGGAASLAIIPDCGHVPHREKQSEVLAAVQKFLHEIP